MTKENAVELVQSLREMLKVILKFLGSDDNQYVEALDKVLDLVENPESEAEMPEDLAVKVADIEAKLEKLAEKVSGAKDEAESAMSDAEDAESSASEARKKAEAAAAELDDAETLTGQLDDLLKALKAPKA